MSKTLLSIVVPVYNEEDNIFRLHEALCPVLDSLSADYDFELIFTDNHSTDKTFSLLKELKNKDPRVRVLRFSKNFGFQRSIYTGYMAAKGEAAIQMDCDLQDPPHLLPAFIAKWREGYKVVFGVRKKRKEGKFITFVRKAFYQIINRLSEDELPLDAGDFRLVDKRILEELKKIHDMQPYLRGEIAKMGFSQIGIEYDRDERKAGKSKFSYSALFRLAVDGIVSNSIMPLRFATYTGLIVSIITFIGVFVFLCGKLFFGQNWPHGFATTTLLILMSLVLNAFFLGIIGEYLGRIYRQINRRPITIIEEEL